MDDEDKRRLFFKLQEELIKTPPGSGRDELRRGLNALAQELGLTENWVGKAVTEELSGVADTDAPIRGGEVARE